MVNRCQGKFVAVAQVPESTCAWARNSYSLSRIHATRVQALDEKGGFQLYISGLFSEDSVRGKGAITN